MFKFSEGKLTILANSKQKGCFEKMDQVDSKRGFCPERSYWTAGPRPWDQASSYDLTTDDIKLDDQGYTIQLDISDHFRLLQLAFLINELVLPASELSRSSFQGLRYFGRTREC